MGPRRKWAAKLDMYRKVPVDLMEGTQQGSIISWFTLSVILVLFYKETASYFSSELVTDLYLDRQAAVPNEKIRVQFNITMMDLRCEYVQMDVVSVLGNTQNVTKYMTKIPIDANGVLQRYAQRNKEQHDIELYDAGVTKTIEELHAQGEDAISLDATTFEFALNENDLVFVDFFASWCSHCRALAPTWETLAKVMTDAASAEIDASGKDYGEEELKEAQRMQLPVMIAKVDCVVHHDLCVSQKIRAYPTLRLFVNGNRNQGRDYRAGRTLTDMVEFLSIIEEEFEMTGVLKHVRDSVDKHLNASAEEMHWAEAVERTRKHDVVAWDPEEHPGCQVAGSIMINKVPGNFHIYPFSAAHDLAPHMTNVSHEIHNLLFSPAEIGRRRRRDIPPNYEDTTHPMNGNAYVTKELHEAYHHYVKLVNSNTESYQALESSQLAIYRNDQVPEAKFIIDISPIAVRYRWESRPWYDYITSLMAIIGGTFTVVGGIHYFLFGIVRMARKRRPPPKPRRGPYQE